MTHDNRGRITVDPKGDWRMYSPELRGFEPLGTVTRGVETGALMRNRHTGIYVKAQAGALQTLDGRKVAAALGTEAAAPGRPAQMAGGRTVKVYLDEASIEAATGIGGGNISEGIRMALRRYHLEDTAPPA